MTPRRAGRAGPELVGTPGKRLLYHTVGHRVCELSQRTHKSNNVHYLADLALGYYQQRCLDPDCRRNTATAPAHPLPPELNPFQPARQTTNVSSAPDDDDDPSWIFADAAVDAAAALAAPAATTLGASSAKPDENDADAPIDEAWWSEIVSSL